ASTCAAAVLASLVRNALRVASRVSDRRCTRRPTPSGVGNSEPARSRTGLGVWRLLQRWFAGGMPVQVPTRVHDLTEMHGTYYCHECRGTWGSRPESSCSGPRYGWVRRPPHFTPSLLRKLKLTYDGEPDELMAVGFVRHP